MANLATLQDSLSFEIKESAIYTNDTVINGYKAISKDNGEILSVMKDSYFPMYNKDFMESVNRMSEISGFQISGYSEIGGGIKIAGHLKNNVEKLMIGNFPIDDYLVLGSSFDGSTSFFLGTSTVLVRCQNQFSRISKMEKVRHTKSSPKRVDELLRTLDIYFKNRKEMFENFERMGNVRIDEKIKLEAMEYILGIKEEDKLLGKVSTRKQNQLLLMDSAMLTELAEVGDNLFGLFNGVTKYTTHLMNEKSIINSGFGNMFGTPADVNAKAYDFALSLI